MTEAWEDVAAAVCAKITERMEPLIDKATDDIYERLLATVQEYLTDNTQFNIGSRITSAERAATMLRARHDAMARVVRDARDLLHAIDRGHFSTDIAESAFVAALRASVAKAGDLG